MRNMKYQKLITKTKTIASELEAVEQLEPSLSNYYHINISIRFILFITIIVYDRFCLFFFHDLKSLAQKLHMQNKERYL